MGREIEIKIPLTDSQYDYVRDVIFGKSSVSGLTTSSPAKLFKKDEYFTRYDSRDERLKNGEPDVIRMRSETIDDDEIKTYFTIKYKKLENAIEVNREYESSVSNPEVMYIFFKEAGYHKWFSKEKYAYSCHCKMSSPADFDFHLELEIVNDSKWLEVEIVKSDAENAEDASAAEASKNAKNAENSENDFARKKLCDFVRLFDLDPSLKEPRSWYEIITGSRKNKIN